jgi:hypothetical protein
MEPNNPSLKHLHRATPDTAILYILVYNYIDVCGKKREAKG